MAPSGGRLNRAGSPGQTRLTMSRRAETLPRQRRGQCRSRCTVRRRRARVTRALRQQRRRCVASPAWA